MVSRKSVFLAGCLLLAPAVSAPAAATPVGEWAIYGGTFNVGKSPTAGEIGFELRLPTRWSGASLVAGAAGTEDGSFWAYGGARYDLAMGGGWRLAPGFAIALYEEGDGKDLGGLVEFRSSLELSYRLGARSRVGLIVYHLSNAGLYDLNPGSNSAVVAWSFAVR